MRFSRPALVGFVPWLLLVVNAVSWTGDTDLSRLRGRRRYWEDVSVAASRLLDARQPTGLRVRSIAQLRDYPHRIRRNVIREAREAGIRAWQPWRTIALKPRLNVGPLRLRDSDDTGRSALLVAGFRVLGGVAPFLAFWLGVLAALPVFVWVGIELTAVGRWLAGALLLSAMACSPFVVEILVLPYSASGFYVLAVLGSAALGGYAALGSSPSLRGLLVRALAAGVLVAGCRLCRASALLPVAGFATAVVVGSLRWRLARPTRSTDARRSWAATVGVALTAGTLLLAPILAAWPSRGHEAWLGIWEGLGDFDRSKGHAFNDGVAMQRLREAGVRVCGGPIWKYVHQAEPYFGRVVRHEIASDPAWYAGILARRLGATLTQAKLQPRGQKRSFSRARSFNEGAIDTYYGMTTTAEWLGFLRWRVELPLAVLWAPPLLLLGAWLVAARGSLGDHAGEPLLVATFSIAALAFPVLITTVGAHEPQTFVLVYFLSFGLLAQRLATLAGRWRPRRGPAAVQHTASEGLR